MQGYTGGVPALVDGVVPLGRWCCGLDDVRAMFVPSSRGVRAEIWDEWTTVLNSLRQAVGEVPACWLSGSFFTDEPNPGDIDCLFVLNEGAIKAAVMADHSVIPFVQAVTANHLKRAYQLRVDSFVMEWQPVRSRDGVGAGGYLQDRGFWDDFWCRMRDPDPHVAMLPRRGYLEVRIDGFN